MFEIRLIFLQFAFLTIDFATPENDVYFIINTPNSTVKPQTILPQGYVRFSDIKIAYKIYANRLNWTNAQEACNSEGARLAVIDTPKKLKNVKNMRQWRNLVWTGIHRKSRNGEWTTVYGGPISPDLPQIHYIPDLFGNCIAAGGLITLTRLRVMSCDATRWYMCEIPDAE